jgi:hypothetical protein
MTTVKSRLCLTDYRIRKARERMREEARILEAVSMRLEALHTAIPAPDFEELCSMEAGEEPLSLEAIWISMLSEQAFLTSESASELIFAASTSRESARRDWFPGLRPDAKVIAHLRGGLRGQTLPEGFRPEFAELEAARLLKGQSHRSTVGVALVTDLLVKGYRWGG